MDAISIADWSGYLAAEAGAGATLTGLVFVAVSINLPRVLSTPGLTGRAAESLMQFAGVVVIATSALIPRQPLNFLGTEIFVLAALLWLTQTRLQVRHLRSKSGHPRSWLATRVIQTQFAYFPFFICGVLLISGSPAGLYWLAPGFFFSLLAGIASAWVLLVEILR